MRNIFGENKINKIIITKNWEIVAFSLQEQSHKLVIYEFNSFFSISEQKSLNYFNSSDD